MNFGVTGVAAYSADYLIDTAITAFAKPSRPRRG
jgi:hypothetical protein